MFSVRGFFLFQAEDGIRDLVRSRGLGDVYKRQGYYISAWRLIASLQGPTVYYVSPSALFHTAHPDLSLIHI